MRALEQEKGRPIGILVDLQGPKIRLGTLPGGRITLTDGERLKLVCAPASEDPKVLPIPHAEVFAALKQKHTLLIDDGKIRLRTFASKPDSAEAFVEVGGVLNDRKGVNLPDTLLPVLGDDGQGPQRPGRGTGAGRGLDRALLRAAARRCGRTEEAGARGAPR